MAGTLNCTCHDGLAHTAHLLPLSARSRSVRGALPCAVCALIAAATLCGRAVGDTATSILILFHRIPHVNVVAAGGTGTSPIA